MSPGARALTRVIAVVAAVGVGFVLLQSHFRIFETAFSVGLLHFLGATGVASPQGVDALVTPSGHGAFYVELTPSCSALPAILAIIALSVAMVPARANRPRWYLGAAAAIVVVFMGNVLRIDGSIGVGLLLGRVSLVLFHDWVGSAFGFASVVGSWILLLWIQLPKGRGSGLPTTADRQSRAVDHLPVA